MARNNLYTFLAGGLIPAGGNTPYPFNIVRASREITIRSILIDIFIRNQTTGFNIPWEQNGDISLMFRIGNFVDKLAQPFDVNPIILFVSNGGHIYLTKPGQYYFDYLFTTNNMEFYCHVVNHSAVNNYVHQLSIAIETQEKILY